MYSPSITDSTVNSQLTTGRAYFSTSEMVHLGFCCPAVLMTAQNEVCILHHILLFVPSATTGLDDLCSCLSWSLGFLWSLVSWYSSISFDSVRLATCTSILDSCRLAILRPYFCPLLPSSPRPYICIKRSSVYAFRRAISVLCLNRLATHARPVLFAPRSFFLLFFLFSCRCCCRSPSDPVRALRMHFAARVGQRGCVDIACQPAKYEVLALLQKSVKRTS